MYFKKIYFLIAWLHHPHLIPLLFPWCPQGPTPTCSLESIPVSNVTPPCSTSFISSCLCLVHSTSIWGFLQLVLSSVHSLIHSRNTDWAPTMRQAQCQLLDIQQWQNKYSKTNECLITQKSALNMNKEIMMFWWGRTRGTPFREITLPEEMIIKSLWFLCPASSIACQSPWDRDSHSPWQCPCA